MANYLSEIERVAMESEARGKVKWEARGEARGIIRAELRHGVRKNEIVTMLINELNIPVEQAEEYYEEFSNQC